MRRRLTLLAVWATSAVVVLACVGWSVLAQHLVPDACTYAVPPPGSQYLDCPTPAPPRFPTDFELPAP